ncbi:hypothetical protein GCM10011613_22030 [Cellvibrio zantedeschiae]|uniref:Uncharacterized protein n=1 Tax=Cellvibrio zantedeschiae TaxID=1237077 RepID=A0ABQ3B3U3_9GAMM|nr:hypothetical protein [Cellvibrio zantedeschiae]GGY77109.1 hypothetical protein GCM10011613_22030 [Cellvibrio zantedeschiae]
MLKVRILAAIVAILLTLLTIYLLPKIVYTYTSFMDGMSPDQRTAFSLFQALLGAALGVYGWWLWKKSKKKK